MIKRHHPQFPRKSFQIFSFVIITFLLCLQGIQFYLFYKTYTQPQVVIVPHHNVVADIRNNYLNQIAKSRIQTKTVIILSPDHFSPYKKQITYSNRDWNLQSGTLKFNSQVGSLITRNASNNPQLVYQDHGIFNLLSQIKSNFPDSQIVPFLIGDQVSTQQLENLVSDFAKFCNSNCLIIASVDFSHYLPPSLADIHDIYSQKILSQLNIHDYFKLEVDSPQSLYVAMRFAQINKADNFQIFAHTNSGRIGNDYDTESTSHVLASYSKAFRNTKYSFPQTFTIATHLDRNNSAQTVGERFFYGVDYIDTNLNASYQPHPKIRISPANISNITYQDNHLNINLGADLIVSGSISNSNKSMVFLPINPDTHFFLRSDQKKQALQELFKNTYLNIDLNTGIVNLD